MDSYGNSFPIDLLDTRWFYNISSFVSDAHSGKCAKESNAQAVVWTARGGDEAQQHVPDRAEMRRVFEKLDENNDGVVCTGELSRFMQRLGFEMSQEDAASLVKTVDHNCDGFVDFDEFYSLYSSWTGSEAADSSDQMHDDQEDHDDNLREAFLIFDKDQNGFITVHELQSVLLSLGMVEGNSLKQCYQMIESVDADRNDQVDFQEFKNMMSSNSFYSR